MSNMLTYHLPIDLIKTINNDTKDNKVNKLKSYINNMKSDMFLTGDTILIDLTKMVDNFMTKNKMGNIKMLYKEFYKTIEKYDNVIMVANEIRKDRYIYFYNNIVKYIIEKMSKPCVLVYFRYSNDIVKYKLIKYITKQNENIKLLYGNILFKQKINTTNDNYHIQIYNNVNYNEFKINIDFNSIQHYL